MTWQTLRVRSNRIARDGHILTNPLDFVIPVRRPWTKQSDRERTERIRKMEKKQDTMDITWDNGNTTKTRWSNTQNYSTTSLGPLGRVHDWKKIVIQYMNLKKYEKDGLPCDGFNCDCVKARCYCGYDVRGYYHSGFRWCPTAKVNTIHDFFGSKKQPSKEASQTSQPDKKTKKTQRGFEKREEKERKE